MITQGWSSPVGSGGRRVGVFLAHTCRSDADTRGLLGNRTEDKMDVWEPGSWSRSCAGSDLHTHASPAIQTCSREQDVHQRHWTDESKIKTSSRSYLAEHISLGFALQNSHVHSGLQVSALRTSSTVWKQRRPNNKIYCEIMFCRSKKKTDYKTDGIPLQYGCSSSGKLVDFITV